MNPVKENKLIAEFMGGKIIQPAHPALPNPVDNEIYGFPYKIGIQIHGDEGYEYLDGSETWGTNELQYHISWDWLMPVIGKTNEIRKQMELKYPEDKNLNDSTGWRAWNYRHVSISTDINLTYKKVIAFIIFYNQHNHDHPNTKTID